MTKLIVPVLIFIPLIVVAFKANETKKDLKLEESSIRESCKSEYSEMRVSRYVKLHLCTRGGLIVFMKTTEG